MVNARCMFLHTQLFILVPPNPFSEPQKIPLLLHIVLHRPFTVIVLGEGVVQAGEVGRVEAGGSKMP